MGEDSATHKVLFKIRCADDKGNKCKHVNYLDKSAESREKEFLFAAYSAFRVESVERTENPTDERTPHVVTLIAAYDNQRVSEDVPTAPWH